MRFNPSFIQLKSTIDEANNFNSSIENANPHRTWLLFCPNEVYNQYILLDDGLKTTLQTSNLTRVSLCDVYGNVIDNNVGFGYKKIIENHCLFLSFKILNDYDSRCLCLRLEFKSGESGRSLPYYSNLFTCTELNREKSSIVTYKHQEDHYEIPYNKIAIFSDISGEFQMQYSNQIRLPLYFLNWKTEQDSTENTYSTNTPTNINVSRVKRRDIKVWKVIANDWINQRLSIVSDTDYVYINGQREITRPFEFEEVSGGSDFSISQLESQPKYGDEYIDEYGLVNHRPVITNIVFDSPCCTPSEDPLIEPEITGESTGTDTCEFEGIHKIITITGEPESTIKYRLTASFIEGTSKEVRVYNSDMSNTHIFDDVSDSFVGFFFTDSDGNATLNIKCCLEECSPGQPISINADLELYLMDGVTLSGETVNIEKSKSCPLPESAEWEIVSETGTNLKKVKIVGLPNVTVKVVAEITLVNNSLGLPNSISMTPALLNEQGVVTGNTWVLEVPLDSSGESIEYDIEVDAGSFAFGVRVIYAIFRIYNYNDTPSANVVGISDINN